MASQKVQGVSFTPGRDDGLLYLDFGQQATGALFASAADSELSFDGSRVSFIELMNLLATTPVTVVLHPRLDHYESSVKAEFFTDV